MRPFTYSRPENEAAAIEEAASDGAEVICGGTGVVDLMRLGVEQPKHLVDLTALRWTQIEPAPNGGLRIGALVRNTDLAWHPEVRTRFPALAEALLAGASPQLRNMASVAGNVMQRTRCTYFRDMGSDRCNKRRPGSGCAAMDGWNRMHAILGTSDACIAAHPSDMCVALAALDAVVHVRGPKGERDIPFTSVHTEPGAHPEVETTLAHGELITHVVVPSSPFAAKSAYVKVRDRASYAFALASACAALEISGGKIATARIALGGVATKPWRATDAEGALVGQAPSTDAFRHAAEAALKNAKPRPGNAFKVELAKRTIVRALEKASA